MDPPPVQPQHTSSSSSSQTHDVPIKTEERVRPIPALPQQQQQQQQQPPQQRVQRYKDKFQSLRERYENVISKNTEQTRAIQRATQKEQHLQAEINMLLDAALATGNSHSQYSTSTMTVTVPQPTGSATATTTTTHTPTPVHAQLSPLESHAVPIPGPPGPPAHMNGHSSSVAPQYPHASAHFHGHGYAANHAPPASSNENTIPALPAPAMRTPGFVFKIGS